MASRLSRVFRTRRGRVRWWAAAVLFVAMLPLLTGCYGKFPLTRAVYKLNGEITTEKTVHTIVMWVFTFVPVYGFATLGDAVVLNLIEFWTGKTISVGQTVQQGDTMLALAASPDGKEVVLTVSEKGKVVGKARFVKVSETEFDARDAEGRLAGRVIRTPDGGLCLTDSHGASVRTISPERLAAAQRP